MNNNKQGNPSLANRVKPLKQQIRIAALVATGSEDMELIVSVDVWRRAHFVVDLISIEKKNSVSLSRGTSIKCTQTLDKTNLKQYNAIFLPGGPGYEKFLLDPKLIEHLRKFNEEKKWLFAICAAPVVFYKLNLLKNNKITCYPTEAKTVNSNYLKEPIVVSENFLTAMSAGHVFDFALKAIELLTSKKEANDVAKEIYYDRKRGK